MTVSTITPKSKCHAGGDQARGLRAMAAMQNQQIEKPASSTRNCHSIVVWGGKGGTGRSVIALNLALSFAKRGDSVGLLDAAAGLGSIELLCGMNGYWNLSHVVHGCRELRDVVLTGPDGVKLLSGANCLVNSQRHQQIQTTQTADQLRCFEQSLDWLIIDASGANAKCDLVNSADDLLIVTTPESTAIAEAYSSVKSVASDCRSRIGLLVNQADSAAQANQILDRLQQAAQSFLQVDLHRRGFISRDPAIPRSVNQRVPFAGDACESPAGQEISKLAERWTRPKISNQSKGFFARLFEQRDSLRSGQLE